MTESTMHWPNETECPRGDRFCGSIGHVACTDPTDETRPDREALLVWVNDDIGYRCPRCALFVCIPKQDGATCPDCHDEKETDMITPIPTAQPHADAEIRAEYDSLWPECVRIRRIARGQTPTGWEPAGPADPGAPGFWELLTPGEAATLRDALNALLCRQCGQSGEVQDGDGRTYACRCVEL